MWTEDRRGHKEEMVPLKGSRRHAGIYVAVMTEEAVQWWSPRR
jgi:hypothetical protein